MTQASVFYFHSPISFTFRNTRKLSDFKNYCKKKCIPGELGSALVKFTQLLVLGLAVYTLIMGLIDIRPLLFALRFTSVMVLVDITPLLLALIFTPVMGLIDIAPVFFILKFTLIMGLSDITPVFWALKFTPIMGLTDTTPLFSP